MDDLRHPCSPELLPTTAVSDALDSLGIGGSNLHGPVPVGDHWRRIGGPARTVRVVTDSSSGMAGRSELMAGIRSGEVLVMAWDTDVVASTCGGNVAREARDRGATGLVTGGYVRDPDEIVALGFPIWAVGLTPVSGSGRVKFVDIGGTVNLGGSDVAHGDIVVADKSGVIVIPRNRYGEVATIARKTIEEEQSIGVLDRADDAQ